MPALPNPWIDRLLVELAIFDDCSKDLLTPQKLKFDACANLLREQPFLRTEISLQLRYGRQRARKLLVDIHQQLGSDAFLLCALAIPITDLVRSEIKSTFTQYRDWWNSVLHPLGLQQISGRLCLDIPFAQIASEKHHSSKDNGEGATVQPVLRQCHELTENLGRIITQKKKSPTRV